MLLPQLTGAEVETVAFELVASAGPWGMLFPDHIPVTAV